MYRNLLSGLFLISFFSCVRDEAFDHFRRPATLPVLYQILDTTTRNMEQQRRTYYYNANGRCDSIVTEIQSNVPNPVPTWCRGRVRFEYNDLNDTLPREVYSKPCNTSEFLVNIIEYTNTGKTKKLSSHSDTIKYYYGINDRLDSQEVYNRFSVWQGTDVFYYDTRNNVNKIVRRTAFSSSIGSFSFDYDSSINPVNKIWAYYQPFVVNLSPNNQTKNGLTGNPPTTITTYQYNTFNQPVKAYLYANGQPNPIKITTYFYQ